MEKKKKGQFWPLWDFWLDAGEPEKAATGLGVAPCCLAAFRCSLAASATTTRPTNQPTNQPTNLCALCVWLEHRAAALFSFIAPSMRLAFSSSLVPRLCRLASVSSSLRPPPFLVPSSSSSSFLSLLSLPISLAVSAPLHLVQARSFSHSCRGSTLLPLPSSRRDLSLSLSRSHSHLRPRQLQQEILELEKSVHLLLKSAGRPLSPTDRALKNTPTDRTGVQLGHLSK